MKIAAIQMVATPDVDRNITAARRLVAQAADAGARLIALPEYFCLMGQRDDDKLTIAEADGDGPLQAFLADTARRHGIWLIGGTLPIRAATADRVRNACCVYGPDGARVARYDKIHLFAFDNGRERYDEGRVLEAGSEPVAFDAEGLRVGLSVCYDLRFPELYRALMQPPCDLLVVPAAFTYTTGQAHWELLLRARAVENQCHVLASAQGGLHENGRRTWGHSMVIDPWGEVLAVQPEGEGMVVADAALERRNAVREQLPALAHRRL
ncbi:MAG TPA: carbon-nitrogen hydrolase family protein [Ideonella sp.]|uniref:carbon-nitrogen hydrolase family protein n=1 Tax=Ideonella sp. TaxID=1929293 RepID=UPI002E30FF3A|nr:carbon-nitrogen hydrolase family protein [Ideonella sp.]HEX5682666.1 carbon-nitrogen hydrolase family protein [Ideonella sp.]